MQCIDEETIVNVWEKVASLNVDDATQSLVSFAENQPGILGFATAIAEDLSINAQEMLTFLLYVIYRIFETASEGGSLPVIDPDEILAKYEENQSLLLGLDNRDDKELAEMARRETSHQPNLFSCVTEALVADEDDENGSELSDVEFSEVFIILKTVIDIIDAKTN